jgi:hypothetical protein
MPAPGRKHLHSKAKAGVGWTRAPDLADDPSYGKLLPHWDSTCPPLLNQKGVHWSVKGIWKDQAAWYGRPNPGGKPYTYAQYAERYHRPSTGGTPDINWPPNEGAVRDTRLLYSDAQQFVTEFGYRIDRIGFTSGEFFGLMEDPSEDTYQGRTINYESVSYEARALHYKSLYRRLRSYTLNPKEFRDRWRICVMETARALGQPGGCLGLVFFDGKGKRLTARQLTRSKALRHDQ